MANTILLIGINVTIAVTIYYTVRGVIDIYTGKRK